LVTPAVLQNFRACCSFFGGFDYILFAWFRVLRRCFNSSLDGSCRTLSPFFFYCSIFDFSCPSPLPSSVLVLPLSWRLMVCFSSGLTEILFDFLIFQAAGGADLTLGNLTLFPMFIFVSDGSLFKNPICDAFPPPPPPALTKVSWVLGDRTCHSLLFDQF